MPPCPKCNGTELQYVDLTAPTVAAGKKAPESGVNEGQDNQYITEGYKFRINLENRSKKGEDQEKGE